MDRRGVILLWLNCFPYYNPLKTLEELVNGNQLIELATIINSVKYETTEISDYTSEKKTEFIKETIFSYYHMEVKLLINLDLFINGDMTETIKVALLLLSAVVMHFVSSSSGKNVLSAMHKLEATVQEEIKNYLQMILEANDFNKLATVLRELSRNTIETSMTPTHENVVKISATPLSHLTGSPLCSPMLKNRKCVGKKLEYESPLKSFIESPLLRHQLIIRKNEKEIKDLRKSLHFEEIHVMELEEQYKDACCQICFKDETINKLKEKIKYLEQFEVIVEEQNEFKTEYEEKITLLEKKYSHCRKCRYLEESKQEVEELQEMRTELEEMLKNMEIKVETLEKDNFKKEEEIKTLLSVSMEKNIKIEDLTQQIELLTKCIDEYRMKYLEECATAKKNYVEPIRTPQRCENETLRGIIDRKNQELEEQLKEKDQQIEALIANLGCILNWNMEEINEIKMNMACWSEAKGNCSKNSYEGKNNEAVPKNLYTITDLYFVNDLKTPNKSSQNKCVKCEDKFRIQINELKRFFDKQLLNKASEISACNETIENYKQKISELEQHILLMQRNYDSIKQERDNGTINIMKLEFEKEQEKLNLQEEIGEYKRHIDDLNGKITALKKDCKHIHEERADVISNMQKLLEEKEFLDQSYQNALLEHNDLQKQMYESLQKKEKEIEQQSIKINELEESRVILENDCEYYKREHENSVMKIKELEYSNIRLSLGFETSRKNIGSCSERELSGYNYNEISMPLPIEADEKSHISEKEMTKINYSETLPKLADELKALRENKIFFTEKLIELEYYKNIINAGLETLKEKYEILVIENVSKKSSLKKQTEGGTLPQENQLKETKKEGNETDISKLIRLEKNTSEKQMQDTVNSSENINAFKLLIMEINERFQSLRKITETLKNINLLHEFFETTNSLGCHSNELFLHLELLNANICNFFEIYKNLAAYGKNDKITYLKCHLSSIYELKKSEIHAACEEQQFIDCHYELEHTKLMDKDEVKKDRAKQFRMRLEELEKVKNSEIERLHEEKAELLKQLIDLQKSLENELIKKDENIKSLQSKCDSYKNMVKVSMNDVKCLFEKMREVNKNGSKTQEEMKRLTIENDHLKEKTKNTTELRSEIVILTNRNQKLKSELDLSRKDISSLKERIERIDNELKFQKEENKKLYTELHVARSEIGYLSKTTNKANLRKRLSFTPDSYDLKNSPFQKGNLSLADISSKPKLQETPLKSKNQENAAARKEGGASFIREDNINSKTTPVHDMTSELKRRNKKCHPQMKSCYPAGPTQLSSVDPNAKVLAKSLWKNFVTRSPFPDFPFPGLFEQKKEDSATKKMEYRRLKRLSATPLK